MLESSVIPPLKSKLNFSVITFRIHYLHQCSAVVQKKNFLSAIESNLHTIGANLAPFFKKLSGTSPTNSAIWEKNSKEYMLNKHFFGANKVQVI